MPAGDTPVYRQRSIDMILEPEELTLDFIGSALVAMPAESAGSGFTDPEPVLAMYTITVPAGVSFPTEITFASIVIRVDSGSVQVVSPQGNASLRIGTGEAIADDCGAVLVESGSGPLEQGVVAVLGAGNVVTSTDEALEVTGGSDGAVLLVTVVIPGHNTVLELCWICPHK